MCYVNKRMSLKEWHKIQYEAAVIAWQAGERNIHPFSLNEREFYMMMPVIYCKYSPQVIFFYQCEYCRGHILDGDDCCKSCSASVENQ